MADANYDNRQYPMFQSITPAGQVTRADIRPNFTGGDDQLPEEAGACSTGKTLDNVLYMFYNYNH
jgi:hypothetical protein